MDWSSITPVLVFIIGAVLLLAGGHWLVEGAVRIARTLGVSTLLIGLTVVAFGTSSPELAFNVTAAIDGKGELALGNIVGSNIANLGLVLGVCGVATGLTVHGRVIKKELPLLIVASMLMCGLAWFPATRPNAGGPDATDGYIWVDGIVLLVVFAGFTVQWYRLGTREREDPMRAELEEEAGEQEVGPLGPAIVLFVLGLTCLVAGGKLAAMGAIDIASAFQVSEGLVGLTIVAISTSLPELVASLIAARKGHSDLAIGNVVGSNLFNILLVLGTTTLFGTVPLEEGRGWTDLIAMLALTLLLLPVAATHRQTIMKWEGALLLACYGGYMTYSIVRELA